MIVRRRCQHTFLYNNHPGYGWHNEGARADFENIYNFLNIIANTTKRREFSYNLSGNDLVCHFIVHVTRCFYGNR